MPNRTGYLVYTRPTRVPMSSIESNTERVRKSKESTRKMASNAWCNKPLENLKESRDQSLLPTKVKILRLRLKHRSSQFKLLPSFLTISQTRFPSKLRFPTQIHYQFPSVHSFLQLHSMHICLGEKLALCSKDSTKPTEIKKPNRLHDLQEPTWLWDGSPTLILW